jgi:hypothetical protein
MSGDSGDNISLSLKKRRNVFAGAHPRASCGDDDREGLVRRNLVHWKATPTCHLPLVLQYEALDVIELNGLRGY